MPSLPATLSILLSFAWFAAIRHYARHGERS